MKWNEVTWYSRLGALILFFGVVPVFAFYVGSEYQKIHSQSSDPVIQPYFGSFTQTSTQEVVEPNNVEVPVEATSTPSKPTPLGACYKGGCSGQLCSDTPDMVSTCEYREEYACYQTASCERQSNGQCGWTETNALKMCLSGANN